MNERNQILFHLFFIPFQIVVYIFIIFIINHVNAFSEKEQHLITWLLIIIFIALFFFVSIIPLIKLHKRCHRKGRRV
jgi:uncharacterized phage infection (PIP) family protein YhgE